MNSSWVCVKVIECNVPYQGNPCYGDSGLAFWSVTTFPGYIWMYTGVHLDVSLWWDTILGQSLVGLYFDGLPFEAG